MGFRVRIAKDGRTWHTVRMKTQTLQVKLTPALHCYVKYQVGSGRYKDNNEVVRDAIRQMQQREVQQFEQVFGEYSGAPQGEPGTQNEKTILTAIRRHRDARHIKQPA
jgi:putative addiction module CopG family antidote